jgi:hypothetical protein
MGSVAAYIVERLSELGIAECFGVPGDFSFPLDDAVVAHPKMRWIGCSNELNAAYAADGYARIRGAAGDWPLVLQADIISKQSSAEAPECTPRTNFWKRRLYVMR